MKLKYLSAGLDGGRSTPHTDTHDTRTYTLEKKQSKARKAPSDEVANVYRPAVMAVQGVSPPWIAAIYGVQNYLPHMPIEKLTYFDAGTTQPAYTASSPHRFVIAR